MPGPSRQDEPIRYFDRSAGAMREEIVLGDFFVRLAYQSRGGRLLHRPLFGSGVLSTLLGVAADCSWSRWRIAPTIRRLGIDMTEVAVPAGGFPTFNAFFTRQLLPGARRPEAAADRLVSPADCRLTVSPALDGDTCIPVKGRKFSVSELLGEQGEVYYPRFRGGSFCVCRLCPADYHRFHYPASGDYLDRWRVNGGWHSVHPIALACGLPILSENLRIVTLLRTDHFGLVAFVEVGAFGVASIVQTHRGGRFEKGEEKGYFAFGGSTLVMLFEPGRVLFDDDLRRLSADGVECLVKTGTGIATLASAAAVTPGANHA